MQVPSDANYSPAEATGVAFFAKVALSSKKLLQPQRGWLLKEKGLSAGRSSR